MDRDGNVKIPWPRSAWQGDDVQEQLLALLERDDLPRLLGEPLPVADRECLLGKIPKKESK